MILLRIIADQLVVIYALTSGITFSIEIELKIKYQTLLNSRETIKRNVNDHFAIKTNRILVADNIHLAK